MDQGPGLDAYGPHCWDPTTWAGFPGPGPGLGTDSSLTSPTAGADHHHVRVGKSQWLCGARLSVCTQAAHHPVSAAKERGQPPHAHQPLRQRSCQSQLQPRPRSASIYDKPLPQLSAWGPLPGLLRFFGWGWSAPQMRLNRSGVGGGGELLSAVLPH